MTKRQRLRRQRTQEERREEAERLILDAATRLIADKGIESFTLADVGEVAGFSRSLPAHYFKTKDGLLSAVIERIRDRHFFSILGLRNSTKGLDDLFSATLHYFDQSKRYPHAAKAFLVFMSGGFYHSKTNKLAAQLNADSLSSIEHALSTGTDWEISAAISTPRFGQSSTSPKYAASYSSG